MYKSLPKFQQTPNLKTLVQYNKYIPAGPHRALLYMILCWAYLWFFIFYSVCFINDHVTPVKLFEDWLLSNDHFIGGDADIPLSWHQSVTNDRCLQNKHRLPLIWSYTVYPSLLKSATVRNIQIPAMLIAEVKTWDLLYKICATVFYWSQVQGTEIPGRGWSVVHDYPYQKK